jgi:hypothetical protein
MRGGGLRRKTSPNPPPDEPGPFKISLSTLVGISHLFVYSLLDDGTRCLHVGCVIGEKSGSRECDIGLECCIHRRQCGWNSDVRMMLAWRAATRYGYEFEGEK